MGFEYKLSQYESSKSYESSPNSDDRAQRKFGHFSRIIGLGFLIMVILATAMIYPRISSRAVPQVEADVALFHELIMSDQGDKAVQTLADLARARGGWEPAPGDIVVYDPNLLHLKRASTIAIDLPPTDCEGGDPKEPKNPNCGRDFQVQQNQVRFGRYTFDNSTEVDRFEPRLLDDVLSVYIEEVGHSWQEFCHETEGRCAGGRTIQTTYRDGNRLVTGWEYQVKMYILSLDGTWLTLSDKEHNELMSAICDGYANPRYRPVSEYSAPPGWPNPEGWPTVAPTADELRVFCAE